MRRITILLLAVMCAGVVWGQDSTNTEKRKIAVYLTASENVESEVKNLINNQVISTLTKTGRYQLIERNDAFVQQIDNEKLTQISGRVDFDQAIKSGGEYGAVAICIVDVGFLKGELAVDMRIVSVKNATIIHTGAADGRYNSNADIRKIVENAVANMLGNTNVTTTATTSSSSTTSTTSTTSTANNPTDAKEQDILGDKYNDSKDYAEAVKWYRKAAEQGYARSQNKLGVMYNNGYGVAQDYNKAVEWYSKAAVQGDADAQFNLGGMYYQGIGVTLNYNEAAKWFSKSATQEERLAQYMLGSMYERGLGVTQDYSKAVEWYRKAAVQRDADAQYSLGVMYQNGYGVTKDISQAIEWYKKAARQRNTSAIDALKKLGITSW